MRRHAKALVAISALLLLTLALGVTLAVATAPSVTIDAPSEVSYTSAHVSGTVDPADGETSYYFQYSKNPEGEGWWSGETQGPLAAGAGVTNVEDDLEGLQPGSEYFVRLVAENADGQSTSAEPNPSFTTKAVALPTVSVPAVSAITGFSADVEATINPGAPAGNPAAFDVDWRIECEPYCGFHSGQIPADAVDHDISAGLTGLVPNRTYKVKLFADNAGGQVEKEASFKTLGVAPAATTLPAVVATADAIQMRGEVNARNAPATYFFEVATRPDFVGAFSVPVSQDATVPVPSEPQNPVEVQEWATGLLPNATYYYRLKTSSQFGSGQGAGLSATTKAALAPQACANAAIREQQEAGFLADCRAWELVSPADKHGYAVGGNLFVGSVQLGVSPDGDRVTYAGLFPIGDSEAGSFAGFEAQRTATGWANASILGKPGPNQTGMGFPGVDSVLRGSTPDGRTSVYWNSTTEPYGSLWVRRGDGSRVRIADASRQAFGQGPGNQAGQPWYEGISADGRHVIFASTDALVPGITSSGKDILYEWIDDGSNGGAGTVRVVNRTNSPTPTLIEPAAGASLGGSTRRLGAELGEGYYALRNAISADGSRIVFQTPSPGLASLFPINGGPVYVRENGTETTEVSLPAAGHTPTNPATGYRYIDASESGRYVFFSANGDLTADADPSGGIYRYDMDDGSLELVSAPGAEFSGIPFGLASADGSVLYVQSSGQITRWEEGQRVGLGKAALTGAWSGTDVLATNILSDTTCVSANVSRDGRFLAFVGTDGNNKPQIFRYDANSDQLLQLTAAPVASAFIEAGSCRGSFPRPLAGRVMSEDGQRIFFETTASLTPMDTNGILDPYQWTPQGFTLLSDGKGTDASKFIGTDATGTNAFILTQSALAAEDGDAVYDVYNVRAGGGFLPPSRAACSGEGCQGPASSAPSSPTAGTAGFSGPGTPPVDRKVKKQKKKQKKNARKAKGKKKGGKGKKKAGKGKGGRR